MRKTVTIGLALVGLLVAVVTSAIAAPPSQDIVCVDDYTVQSGDWLSTIAEKYYGDVLAYTAIVNATNIVASQNSKYTAITDPSIIEVSQVLCIPDDEEAEAVVNGQVELAESAPLNPEDKLLAIIGNRSFENIPTTVTFYGGEFGEQGTQFNIDAGEEIRLEIEPGDYEAAWSSAEGVTFRRVFEARPGVVAINWMVPEQSYVFAEVQRTPLLDDDARDHFGQFTTPSVQSMETPYQAPEGKELLVAGNRSFAFLPSTFTISGGQFGGGKEFIINPGQELLIALDPVEYTVSWTSPPAEDGTQLSRGGTLIPTPGNVSVIWVIPEQNQAIVQSPGQPGRALE